MAIFTFIISVALLIPFFGWGIHTLRERYVKHEELSRRAELFTLLGVIAFYTFQIMLLRAWIGGISFFFIFSALGVTIAATALYGPIFVSVVSQLIVDLIHPPEEHPEDQPQFTSADALHEAGDHEGALNEYMVMARVFPKDPDTALRTADALVDMDRMEEATEAFERGISLIEDPERAVMVSNRLAEIYQRRMNRPQDAVRVLQDFIETYPDSERAESIQKKIDRIMGRTMHSSKSPTELLDSPPADRWG